MNGALVFLASRSFTNVILFRLKRLRQPKYLAGAFIGAAYFYFYFYRFLFAGNPHPEALPPLALDGLGAELGALLFFGVVIIFSWLWPGSRAALSFTEAETAWLFPAPLDRTTLIRFKLLKSQLGLLLLAFLMTLLSGRFTQGTMAWMHLAGWWFVFSTLQLHRLGASFALQRLTTRGLTDRRRRLAVVFVVTLLIAAVYFWQQAIPQFPTLADDTQPDEFTAWLRGFLHAGPAPWILWPFRLVVQPWAATDLQTFLRAVPPALGILALHYLWVIRAQVSFEEASLALTQKRAAQLAARRSGDLRVSLAARSANAPLFRLGPTGFKPVAFFWKHALSTGGRRNFRRWLTAAALLLSATWALSASGRWPNAQIILGLAGLAVFVLIALTNANSGALAIRRDLAGIDLLKTTPVPGWQVVLGQVLGPVCFGTLLQWTALAVSTVSLHSAAGISWPEGVSAPILALALGLLAPAFNLAMMIIPIGVILLFPAWFKSGDSTTHGLEMMGLRLLMLLGQLLVVGLALLPAVILGGAAALGMTLLGTGLWAPVAGAAAAAITLTAEAGAAITWLGWLFDHYELS